ncbi:hypothetical protein FOXYSP1_16207 [Fusarium oxysporum f. sp. phaseoli]
MMYMIQDCAWYVMTSWIISCMLFTVWVCNMFQNVLPFFRRCIIRLSLSTGTKTGTKLYLLLGGLHDNVLSLVTRQLIKTKATGNECTVYI